jgi:hypothetical protein
MKNNMIWILLLIILNTHAEPPQVTLPAELVAQLQQAQTQEINPNVNMSFSVVANNSQDARAQNTTTNTPTQVAKPVEPQPAKIIIEYKHQEESTLKQVGFSLFTAALHLGIAILTKSSPIPAGAAQAAVKTSVVSHVANNSSEILKNFMPKQGNPASSDLMQKLLAAAAAKK